MRQEYKEEAVVIFARLVASKRSGSMTASGQAYDDLNTLADHVAAQQEAAENKPERY